VLEKVTTIPGYAAKQAEVRKSLADKTSGHPIASLHGGPHVMVPLTIEDGGMLGAHAHAFLMVLATSILAKRRSPPVARRTTDAPRPMLVSLWV
jgi:hypothetical protein